MVYAKGNISPIRPKSQPAIPRTIPLSDITITWSRRGHFNVVRDGAGEDILPNAAEIAQWDPSFRGDAEDAQEQMMGHLRARVAFLALCALFHGPATAFVCGRRRPATAS